LRVELFPADLECSIRQLHPLGRIRQEAYKLEHQAPSGGGASEDLEEISAVLRSIDLIASELGGEVAEVVEGVRIV